MRLAEYGGSAAHIPLADPIREQRRPFVGASHWALSGCAAGTVRHS